jgi:hypothetical protein
VTYSHLGLLRNRLPTIWDTVDAALMLVTVPVNAATGRHNAASWFFWAAAYSVLGLSAVKINLWQATREPALSHLPRIGRFGGPYTFLWVGGPGYLAMSVASYYHLTTPPLEVAATATAAVAAVAVAILFMREWREAVLAASAAPAPGLLPRGAAGRGAEGG